MQYQRLLYNACIPYVYSIAKRYIPNAEDVKDQTQEVFATVFQKIDHYNADKGTFNSWLRAVTVNQCLSHLRKGKNLSTLNVVELTEKHEKAEDIDLDGMTREDVERILINMPIGYKMVFMLNVIDGYNHSEIQEMLGIRKETSRSQLTRAKKWIKNNLNRNNINSSYGIF